MSELKVPVGKPVEGKGEGGERRDRGPDEQPVSGRSGSYDLAVVRPSSLSLNIVSNTEFGSGFLSWNRSGYAIA